MPIGAGLTGPTGTAAELVTSGPPNVSALAEDSLGRLWLATAAFTDTGTDAIYVVTNAGEGLLEVVPGMHTPMGLLWIDDELYVSSIEGITVFRGFDGSRFAEEETILTFPGGGVAGSIVLGVDGRLRVGISAPCNACEPESRWAAAVVSFLPDGSGAEIEASGIRAAVGLAYIPGTTDLLATMNQRDDLDELTPGDYLAVVASGQDWGFPECYGQGGTACEGVPVPVVASTPGAVLCGRLHDATDPSRSRERANRSDGRFPRMPDQPPRGRRPHTDGPCGPVLAERDPRKTSLRWEHPGSTRNRFHGRATPLCGGRRRSSAAPRGGTNDAKDAKAPRGPLIGEATTNDAGTVDEPVTNVTPAEQEAACRPTPRDGKRPIAGIHGIGTATRKNRRPGRSGAGIMAVSDGPRPARGMVAVFRLTSPAMPCRNLHDCSRNEPRRYRQAF
ncbi:MAG: hypothetical protein IPI33_16215 [Dehalococcoidia bacterium]|nr:hypothetical protein [Dehalococcoidia bacterium]